MDRHPNKQHFEENRRGRGFGQRNHGGATNANRTRDRSNNWRNRGNQRNENDNNYSRRSDEDRRRPPYNENQNSTRSDNQYSRKPRQMGFKRLQELIDIDNLEEIVLTLNDDKKGFKELLSNKMSPDMIVLVVKILSKVCDCAFQSAKTSLLNSAIESEFAQHVISFITTLVIQNDKDKRFNSHFWKDPDDFWNNIIKICKQLHDLVPSTSCECTLKLLKAVKISIPIIENNHAVHIADNIKSQVASLHDIIEKTAKEVERKKEVVQMGMEFEDEEPPEDFREINVYPSSVEITTNINPFLRPNVVVGPYQNVNHYLDIQYRLLREDFVMPLRKDICRYIKDPKDKLENLKIYELVKFISAETVSEQNCYRVQFEFSRKKKNFQFENSKRFMFGSLLCFTDTRNKFKTIRFAKVVERKIEDLEKGQLIVGFNVDVDIPEDIYETDFMMIESKVYFEPYYQVLNVLKNMQIENFPMERYIIEVKTDTRPPDYLLKIDPEFYNIEAETFWPLNWGERQFYGLNNAQNEAFQSAITREFVIIQGPPGTGKTFLGLKIAKTLLENTSAWYNKTPMLVICFTNHALDQFLEGLLETTKNLIRVGGQSKNQNLNAYNLRNRKHRIQTNPSVIQRKIEVRNCMQEIATLNTYLNEIDKYNSVVDFNVFADVVENYRRSWFATAKNENIISWLFGGQMQQQFTNRPRAVQDPQENEGNADIDNKENEENKDRENDEVVDDIFDDLKASSFTPLFSLNSLNDKIRMVRRELAALEHDDQLSHYEKDNQADMLHMEMYTLENNLDYLTWRLEEGANKTNTGPPEYINMANPHNLPPDDRWQLYFHWLSLYENRVRQKKETVSLEFRRVYAVYNEMRDIEDTQVMKGALVVGMTTTGAARLNASLHALKSPIIIVEEAAEVLESHIIAALTSHCKHLILIGDHQQLKPSAASYTIETKYKLNISLFQRMVDNKVQCHTLNVQHRMRPEIANLIRPTIYPVLEDHASVFGRPSIMGVEHDLFFIDHQEKENVCSDNSKKNVHEATFLIQFARHLILNGYKPENLIILAAYLGQMFEMQRERRLHMHLLQDVRIAVLDNYQGEESDIVLLSLVRSNKENKIGFLRTENRVCVALSRARNGFYIMGNMKQLCNNSEIWPKINETLKQQKAIGPYLTLRCQVHTHQTTNVKAAKDFARLPEGGCDLLCEAALNCGHYCKRLCHVEDRDHSNYDCREKCEKLLCDNNDHACKKFCFQKCGPCFYPVRRELKCGHSVTMECHLDPATYKCMVLVDSTLPCEHKTEKPCSVDPVTFKCTFPCDTRVEPCGHACIRNCHASDDPDHLKYKCRKPCEKPRKGCKKKGEPHICTKGCFEECVDCLVAVMKKRTKCDHMYRVACKEDPDNILCERPCKKMLPCGHKCKKKCDEPCGNCDVLVVKAVPDCNHKIKIACSKIPDRKYCAGKCPRSLECGHLCGKKCNEDCRTRCKEIIDCSIPSSCGHTIKKIKCYLKNSDDPKNLLSHCTEKCNAELECEHRCPGTCGECFQGRFHQRCSERCGIILVCSHECPIPCREACKPCQKPCEYRCKHSKCMKKCGDPCTKCKEKCPRFCEHQRCRRRCGDICSTPPCSAPCPKKLKCSHPCVGFCKDPCPELCRICHNEDLTEFFFGTEDEDDARFVVLVDCGHILESNGMEQWLKTDEDQIKPKVCPKCKTIIKQTQRYSDYVKTNLEDLQKVKIDYYGNTKEIEKTKAILLKELMECEAFCHRFGNRNREMLDTLRKFTERLKNSVNGRRQDINKIDLAAIRAKVDIFKMLQEPLRKDELNLVNLPQSTNQIKFILNFLVKNIDSISKQESDDLVLEINRLQRWIQFERINYRPYMHIAEVVKVVGTIRQLLESPARFHMLTDKNVKLHLEELKKHAASTFALTDAERRVIVKAMGFKQGHWYKCPNGHVYCIADCGGAMVTSKCNECGAQIGGASHRLLDTNAVATEMDGARHGAWTEQANMENYQL